MSTVTVSVRVRREVKEELERAGIDVAEAVRRYLEELAWRTRLERTIEKWDRLLSGVKPSRRGFSEESVRRDRDSR